MESLIIRVDGGYAVVVRDPVANTTTATAYDGARVSYAGTGNEALALAALVAAPDERDLETLKRAYDCDVTQLKPIPRLRVGEHVLDAYDAEHTPDEVSWPSLLAFAKGMWGASKGDYSWPEFWSAVGDEVIKRGLGRF